MTDRRIVLAAAFLRALATGTVGVLIGLYLARRGFDAAEIGVVVAAGLGGGAAAALVVTLVGDRFGRRRSLVLVAVLGAAGGLGVVLGTELGVVVAAACVGMVNGMGRDRGAALIIDQVVLPATSSDAERTKAFAWYNVVQDAGHALGGLVAGAPALLHRVSDIDEVAATRLALFGYCGALLATALLYSRLSPAVERAKTSTRGALSPETKRVLWKISSLFAFDSLAGGFLTAALLALFFFERFGVSEGALGLLFFGARVANAGSHFGAAWLARRIGLVNTMVFTHIPSSLCICLVPFVSSLGVVLALLLVRAALSQMDVPTRTSYVMAIVTPPERMAAASITVVPRSLAAAASPVLAGWLMTVSAFAWPLLIGGALKIAYDLALLAMFRRVRPPEEAARRAGVRT
jgi:MFS family permease